MAEFDAYKVLNENKIDKSVRNCEKLNNALIRATKGEFDEDTPCVTGGDLLKVNEKWNIRRQFNLDKAGFQYKLYKEVFYIQDPHKYYFDDTCKTTVYRRVSAQHEVYTSYGQIANVVARYKCDIIDGDTGKKLTLKDVEKDLPRPITELEETQEVQQ